MFLVQKTTGVDKHKLYAMKVVEKAKVMKTKIVKLINYERQVTRCIIVTNMFHANCWFGL